MQTWTRRWTCSQRLRTVVLPVLKPQVDCSLVCWRGWRAGGVERITQQRSNMEWESGRVGEWSPVDGRTLDSRGMGLGCVACWMLDARPGAQKPRSPGVHLSFVPSPLSFCPCPRRPWIASARRNRTRRQTGRKSRLNNHKHVVGSGRRATRSAGRDGMGAEQNKSAGHHELLAFVCPLRLSLLVVLWFVRVIR